MGENKDCRFGTMFSTTDANCGRKSFAYKFHNGSVGYTVPCLNYECTLTYISLHKKFHPFYHIGMGISSLNSKPAKTCKKKFL